MKQAIFIGLFFWIHVLGVAQSTGKYLVFFKDKGNESFDPYAYFDEKAIERRLNQGIPLDHYTDRPVCSNYIETVCAIVDSSSYALRWFNALIVYGNPEQMAAIETLSFVDSVSVLNTINSSPISEITNETSVKPNKIEKLIEAQLNIMESNYFEQNQINGSGIRIAILDAGFPGVNKSDDFLNVRDNNRIIATYDFVKNKESVYDYSSHGTNVMSCIGGIHENKNIGLATEAEFLLARTENAKTEPFSEEENWLAAIEWADKHGAQIVNSSLAYTKHRYFTDEMDGLSSFVSRAANIAARKGILVVNAAGNDGENSWKVIGTPADADSVLTVGGINPYTNYHINFSSFGPTADKRMKPNVCTYGEAVVGGGSSLRIAQGTSFASPLIAGFAACVWQLHPEYTNMQVFEAIEQSAHLFPYFDYAHGFGIPQASYFFEEQIPSLQTIAFDETPKHIVIRINDGEYKSNQNGDYVYIHIENEKGYLSNYKLVKVESQSPTEIKKKYLKPGYTLRAYYKGYVASYKM